VKICFVLEGSYPYVRGGVSSWVDTFIRNLPEHEFVLWTIGDTERKRGQYQYELPKNVSLVQENFLDSALKMRIHDSRNIRFTPAERGALKQLITCKSADWPLLLGITEEKVQNPVQLLMSEALLDIIKEFAHESYPSDGFLDLFWTIRSMFLPVFYLMQQPVPEATLYHSLSTGYGGLMGALAGLRRNRPFVLSEHGIYTREREEEILLSDWMAADFRTLWISFFNLISKFCYSSASRVTSLFEDASNIQQEMGCPPDKCDIVANGIHVERFASVPSKEPDDWIDIGAIVRIAAIKDIKTLIYAFSNLKHEMPNVRLHIIGPVEDEDYYQECLALIKLYDVKDIIFTGVVDTAEYMRKLDFTTLTSISEGQPYAVIESMAAGRPVVATNVGSCRELIEGGAGDPFGDAGICVPPMHQGELSRALAELCRRPRLRQRMGEAGRRRAAAFFDLDRTLAGYLSVYEKANEAWQELALS
jgi:glycosyltransferase involved in cell wall biosynthesis